VRHTHVLSGLVFVVVIKGQNIHLALLDITPDSSCVKKTDNSDYYIKDVDKKTRSAMPRADYIYEKHASCEPSSKNWRTGREQTSQPV
jgi:hypothetical protein